MDEKLVRKVKWGLFFLGKLYIPLLGYTRPKLIFLSENEVKVKIKLRRRTRNHLKSMYFGALAVGADTAAGIHAFAFSRLYGVNLSLAFKAVEGQFLKRAETDVIFVCKEGQKVAQCLKKSQETTERINQELRVEAFNTQGELVAVFKMTLSVKVK